MICICVIVLACVVLPSDACGGGGGMCSWGGAKKDWGGKYEKKEKKEKKEKFKKKMKSSHKLASSLHSLYQQEPLLLPRPRYQPEPSYLQQAYVSAMEPVTQMGYARASRHSPLHTESAPTGSLRLKSRRFFESMLDLANERIARMKATRSYHQNELM